MKTEIKNGTVFDGIIKIEFFYRWRPIKMSPKKCHYANKKQPKKSSSSHQERSAFN
jgi:hypothetical protein